MLQRPAKVVELRMRTGHRFPGGDASNSKGGSQPSNQTEPTANHVLSVPLPAQHLQAHPPRLPPHQVSTGVPKVLDLEGSDQV